jgi:hypothetical protein
MLHKQCSACSTHGPASSRAWVEARCAKKAAPSKEGVLEVETLILTLYCRWMLVYGVANIPRLFIFEFYKSNGRLQ